MDTSRSRLIRRPLRARHRGAALVVGLMFLVLLTLLATVAMRQSITQERMAGGFRNATLARNGAESALRFAERSIFAYYQRSNGMALVGDAAASQGVHLPKSAAVFAFRDYKGFTSTGASIYPSDAFDFTGTTENPSARLAAQPAYMISDLGRMRPPGAGTAGEGGATGKENYEGSGGLSPSGNSDIRVYRITARSTGGLATVVRAVESTYVGRAKG